MWIRGVGVVSSLGADWPTTARSLARGDCGITAIDRFDTDGMPCRVGSVVPIEGDGIDGIGDRRCTLAVHAVDEAWSRAAVDVRPERLGVFVGAESGLTRFAAAFEMSRRTPEAARAWTDPARTSASAVAWAVAHRLGAMGPCRTLALACASSGAAMLEALRALRSGACDAAICVGAGADVDPLKIAAFGRLGALSQRERSSPFDASRDGFVLGEGAAAVVLSIDRGASVVELAGGARTFDGKSIVAPDPDSDGARRAIVAALADAGVERIGYVAAHGTSTPVGDAAEARALRAVLGDDLGGARVGAVKGALGHWAAGAAALGAVCAWHAIANDELLPAIGVEHVDADCALPLVRGVAERARVETALACSFGFGGANACLVMRRAA